MAETMTFTSLVSDVQSYIERADPTVDPVTYAQIPKWVNDTERDVADKLKILGQITPLNFTLVAGQYVYDKPDRWRKTTSLQIAIGDGFTQSKVLKSRAYEFIRTYWPITATEAEPIYYGDYDYAHWIIAPTPALAHPAEVVCYMLPELLDEDNQTNWLTEYVPEGLRWGVLQRAGIYIKNDGMAEQMKMNYAEKLGVINAQDLQRVLDRVGVRAGV